MDNPLRVLLVDDDAAVREAVVRLLTGHFPGCAVTGAGGAAEFDDALAAGGFDVAVTDYDLPWTDGLAVCRRLRERWSGLPVLMFTGSGSEEIAAEAFKAGVDDYLLKSAPHLRRLPAAVHAALLRAEDRRKRLEAETLYRQLFDHVPVGLYRTTADGLIVEVNPYLVRLLGAPDRAALLGRRAVEFYVDPDDRRQWQARVDAGEAGLSEFRLRTLRGEVVWVENRIAAVGRDDRGRVLHYDGTVTDITARKRAELELRSSEERSRILSEIASDYTYGFLLRADASLTNLWVSSAFTRITGYRPEEMEALGWYPLLHPDDMGELEGRTQKLLSGRSDVREYRIRARSGETRWLHDSTHVVRREPDGGVVIYGAAQDITERKRAEGLLARAEARYRDLFENAAEGIFQLTPGGRFVTANPALARMFGCTGPGGLLGADARGPDADPVGDFRRAVLQALDDPTGHVEQLEVATRRLDGAPLCLSVNARAVAGAGRPRLYEGTVQDITNRKRAEEEVRASRARLAAIVESAMDAIISVDEAQNVVLFNPAAERMFRVAAAEVLGGPLERLLPERYRAAHRRHVEEFGRTGPAQRLIADGQRPVLGLRADGEEFPVEASVSQTDIGGRKLFSVIVRDISGRLRAQARIRQQAALLDTVSDAVVLTGLDDLVQFWNRGAEQLYGWAAGEVRGRRRRDLIYRPPAAEFENAWRVTTAEGAWSGELRQITRDGKEIVVQSRWTLVRDGDRPCGVLTVNSDVTEQKKLMVQFLRAQRLESVGILAGGIAHDLNNVLTPILMSVKLLGKDRPAEDRQRLLATLEASTQRGADMIKRLLSFAGGLEGQPVPLNPRGIVDEIRSILDHTLPKSIAITIRLAEPLWPVRGDITQMSQVLMNLCVNARDAMPRGGTLTIAADNVVLDEAFCRRHLDARPGRHVRLTVEDTGTGIPPDVLDRMFDPFFTTKEHGKGTGLGLSTALGIVRGHGGFIDVASAPGQGSCFAVHLPAVTAPEPPAAAHRPRAEPAGQGQTVLVVDDETVITMIARKTLERHGYRVLTAADGLEAVNLFRAHAGAVQAVVLDMMMPVMDGPTALRAMREIDPAVRVIGASGLVRPDAAQADLQAFLSKPYTAEQLLNAVGQVLAR